MILKDEPPYPWSEPLARELHRRLVDTFYEPSEARTLIKAAKKPDVTKIAFEGRSIHQIWVDTLDRAAAAGALRSLMTHIADEASPSAELTAFLRELLAAKSPPVAPSVGGKDRPAVALLTKPEALLYGQDLSESVGDIPGLLAAVERVMTWRSAIGCIRVLAADGNTYVGTGTLLVGNRMLTNHHVVYPEGFKPTSISVSFNFELDSRRQNLASLVVAGDVATIKASADDDWATFAIDGSPPEGVLAFDLAAQVATPMPSERAFILQHPRGKEKRLAFVRNHVSEVAARRVYYVTDTEGGSSGSPVFNGQGQLIALHRAGGVPQKFPGAPPVKNNEGVRVDVIAPAIIGS
ncbi:trypsin-like peptidase domain-containing protein [Sorangium sp. So ce385]|uniref:trypsin-like peptidase domain-containing protein n=1 Tax=Sorangium sp. So ce385 TaxID=3133308 RepID=UPI003F5BDA7F